MAQILSNSNSNLIQKNAGTIVAWLCDSAEHIAKYACSKEAIREMSIKYRATKIETPKHTVVSGESNGHRTMVAIIPTCLRKCVHKIKILKVHYVLLESPHTHT